MLALLDIAAVHTQSTQSVSFIWLLFSQSIDKRDLFPGAGASRSPFQASDVQAFNAQYSRPLGGAEWRATEQPPELAGQSDPLDDGYRTPPASPSRRLLNTGSVSTSPASSASSAVGGGLRASTYSVYCKLSLCLCPSLLHIVGAAGTEEFSPARSNKSSTSQQSRGKRAVRRSPTLHTIGTGEDRGPFMKF